MSDTPETDATWKDCTPSDHKGLAILATMRKIERERDEIRAKLQYVAGQLIDAGCDDGAAPVEELARRAKKDITALKAEFERLKADKARLDWMVVNRAAVFHDIRDNTYEVRWTPQHELSSDVAFSEWTGCEYSDWREAIDAAMKGAE